VGCWLIAATVSYLHMHALVELHGQPGWVAALTPLSVDGMIVAASTTVLADSRAGSSGGVMPWVLLVVGSVASLAANVAVAEPTVTGRVIAAWPSFALIAAYELLMRQVRRAAGRGPLRGVPAPPRQEPAGVVPSAASQGSRSAGRDLQRQAWQWAVSHRAADGSLPSGRAVAASFGRHERWGRLVKRLGAGENSQTPVGHESPGHMVLPYGRRPSSWAQRRRPAPSVGSAMSVAASWSTIVAAVGSDSLPLRIAFVISHRVPWTAM
jgi:Protein of unknown function (DUF2637)